MCFADSLLSSSLVFLSALLRSSQMRFSLSPYAELKSDGGAGTGSSSSSSSGKGKKGGAGAASNQGASANSSTAASTSAASSSTSAAAMAIPPSDGQDGSTLSPSSGGAVDPAVAQLDKPLTRLPELTNPAAVAREPFGEAFKTSNPRLSVDDFELLKVVGKGSFVRSYSTGFQLHALGLPCSVAAVVDLPSALEKDTAHSTLEDRRSSVIGLLLT